MNTVPTNEDRTWAVISHLSAIAGGMGLLLPVIGWSEQRRKSKYASFQCLQALGYQSLGYTVWFLTYPLLVLVFAVILFVALSFVGDSSINLEVFMGTGISLMLLVVFGLFIIYFLLPLIAAISCALGKDFRYPILGNRLANYLGYFPTQAEGEQIWFIEDHEDRWVAAMGHFSVIILFWGMLAPLATWILQGKRNLFLRFQSIQTFIYQAGVFFLFLGAGFIALAGMLIFPITMWVAGPPDANAPIGMIGMVFLLLIMLIAIAIILLIPLFHVAGQYAGYRILKGDDYSYPLVGKLVGQWISKQVNSGEEKLA
ncbi:MAG TPA: DUF4870 domain-containing protein [Anaerolineales bacterium]|nr:DUF4870 domain-containing protein [Anaerolineales bacterium]